MELCSPAQNPVDGFQLLLTLVIKRDEVKSHGGYAAHRVMEKWFTWFGGRLNFSFKSSSILISFNMKQLKSNSSAVDNRSTSAVGSGGKHDRKLRLFNWIVLWDAIFSTNGFSLFSFGIHIPSSVLRPCFHRFRTSHLRFVSSFNAPRGKAEKEADLPGNIGI